MGLLKKGNLLGKGHHVYMDNYYSSPELFWELHFKETYACGTCRSNRKNMPESVTKAKLKKKGECVFQRNGPLLCLKWKEKKDVTMLSTAHEAIFVETGHVNRDGKKIEKPECINYYCARMGGVDLSDQLLNYYSFLRKSMKWSRKLLIHLFNLVILNAYILNRHYGCKKLNHDEFRDHLVKYLIQEGLKSYKIPLPPVLSSTLGKYHVEDHNERRLSERHFLKNIPAGEGRKRQKPSRRCFVCSKLPGCKKKRTSFWCEECCKPLCISNCFEIFHTELNYKEKATEITQQGNIVNV